jgi:hypothetical protein
MSYLTRTSPRWPDRPVGSRTGPIRQPAVSLARRNAIVALDENGQEDESPGESSALAAMAGGRKGGGDGNSVPVPLLRACALRVSLRSTIGAALP